AGLTGRTGPLPEHRPAAGPGVSGRCTRLTVRHRPDAVTAVEPRRADALDPRPHRPANRCWSACRPPGSGPSAGRAERYGLRVAGEAGVQVLVVVAAVAVAVRGPQRALQQEAAAFGDPAGGGVVDGVAQLDPAGTGGVERPAGGRRGAPGRHAAAAGLR